MVLAVLFLVAFQILKHEKSHGIYCSSYVFSRFISELNLQVPPDNYLGGETAGRLKYSCSYMDIRHVVNQFDFIRIQD